MTVRQLFTPEQVAKLLSVSIRTLEDWRYKKKGPKYIRLMGKQSGIRYPEDLLDDFLAEEMRKSLEL